MTQAKGKVAKSLSKRNVEKGARNGGEPSGGRSQKKKKKKKKKKSAHPLGVNGFKGMPSTARKR